MNNDPVSVKQGLTFSILVTLVLFSVAISLLHLSAGANNALILIIAFIMAGFVILQYMGLRWEGPLVVWTFLIPVILFAILVIALIPDIAHYCPAFLGKL